MNTKTTLDQKTSRSLLNNQAASVLAPLTISLLRYLTSGCYWTQKTEGGSYRVRADFEVSVETIAKNMGLKQHSVHTALAHIKRAEDIGLITVNRPEDGNISYSLHLDQMQEWPTRKQAEKLRARLRREEKFRYMLEERRATNPDSWIDITKRVEDTLFAAA